MKPGYILKNCLKLFALVILLSSLSPVAIQDFKGEQLQYPRVREAYKEKLQYLQELYHSHNVDFFHQRIFLRAFKTEKILELWATSAQSAGYTLVKTYPFCRASGCVGPKRVCGDKQVPEGFYFINKFNPSSDYYLSLGIDYPNASDRILGSRINTGGDIFIHGNCLSVGCIAVTDDLIKELYVVAVEAYAQGQHNIPVHIFPVHLTDSVMQQYEKQYDKYPLNIKFWKNLKEGYDFFSYQNTIPDFTIDNSGTYIFKNQTVDIR